MDSLISVLAQLFDGGLVISSSSSGGMTTQIAWVLGIGFVAVAVSIASYIDNM